MSFDDLHGSLDSPLAQDPLPADLPNLRAAYGRTLAETYRFCTRCWMPLAPIRRCRCAPEPYPEHATPARLLAEHPAVEQLAAAVAAGRYADDTACREQRWLEWLAWLVKQGKLGASEFVAQGEGDAPESASPIATEAQSNHTSDARPNNS